MASVSPRIAEARSRAASVKRAIILMVVAGFLALFVLARASHPGGTGGSTAAKSQAQAPRTVLVPVTGESDDGGTLGFNFGSGSIAPSQPQSTAPSVQTHTS
jgi:hypothetical protein